MAQYVEVVAYRPEWRAVYEKERERIAAILGRNLLEIHIFERGNRRDIIRHLAVRDYLRAHSDEQAAYGALKRELAERYPYDIAAYCDGKEAFVQALEPRALDWYHACRAV